MKRTGPTNPALKELIQKLNDLSRKENVKIWARLAFELERPTRQRRIVNLSSLEIHTKDNDEIVVPGKVLATGDLSHKLNVTAFRFSESAVEKIKQAKGSCLSIDELMKKNPKGKGLRIMG
jgi:large subunit ribosomal protein L18e